MAQLHEVFRIPLIQYNNPSILRAIQKVCRNIDYWCKTMGRFTMITVHDMLLTFQPISQYKTARKSCSISPR